MVQCPECNQQQDADFGMVTCSSCGAVFMVELDGSVNQPEAATSDEVFSAESDDVLPEDSPSSESETESSAEVVESTYDENFLDPLSQEATSEEAPGTVGPAAERLPPEDPLGLQKFEKSGGANLADGEYLYDILIRGIDSGEIKKELLLALTDKRFSLEMESVRSKVRNGELLIEGLNPVRAMLIVLKIQEMDVQIEWRQKHFTQEEADRSPEVET